jgi:hypothetical protein
MKEHGDVIAEGISTSASNSPLAGEWNREGCQRDLEEKEGMAVRLGGALPSEAWWRSTGSLCLPEDWHVGYHDARLMVRSGVVDRLSFPARSELAVTFSLI